MLQKTFNIYTFGCRVNQAESREIADNLLKRGFIYKKRPNFYIINTCVVTKKAEREVKKYIRRIKKESSKTFLIVLGCAVDYWQKNLNAEIKQLANLALDNNSKKNIPYILDQIISSKKAEYVYNKTSITKYEDSNRRFIKIQNGCDICCSYCIVPYVRGIKVKSKKISAIISEVKKAEKDGILEITFTGVNIGLFGKDTGETITQLLKAVLKDTKVPLISFGSIYPKVINNDLINIYKNDWLDGKGRLARFFHIPLQSASENILKLMKRSYTIDDYQDSILKLTRALPQALIATDIIIGFSNETKAEFNKTLHFLKGAPIYKYHLFRYSPRLYTAAFYFQNKYYHASNIEKKQRYKFLKKLEKYKFNQFIKRCYGKKFIYLVSQRNKEYTKVILDNHVEIRLGPNYKIAKDYGILNLNQSHVLN